LQVQDIAGQKINPTASLHQGKTVWNG